MQIVIPLGGLSKRYGLTKPKWLLTHPDGRYMLEHAIDCITSDETLRPERILLILTEEVMSEFSLPQDILHRIFGARLEQENIWVQFLSGHSSSQLETVCRGLEVGGVKGPVIIKDCDNRFTMLSDEENFIAVRQITQGADIRRLQMKSFVKRSESGKIESIVEKKIIGDEFCAGAYGFKKAEDIVAACRLMEGCHREYMSDVINYLIRSGQSFRAHHAAGYEDWGTVEEWNQYCSTFRNLFIDLDGVIFENGSRAIDPKWGENPIIKANVDAIQRIMSDRVRIYFLTARPETYRAVTQRQLRAAGLSYQGLVMGLLHAKRTLVNDFSRNPGSLWPTAEAINVIRNSEDLANIINYWPIT